MLRKLNKFVAFTLIFSMVFISTPSWVAAASPEGGCNWSSPTACIVANIAGGSAIGAATGAIAGLFSKGKKGATTGAIAGGVAGGLMAFAIAWGKCFACFTKIKSEPTKDYATTQKETGYSPQQGVVLKLNQPYSITPTVAPGGTANFTGNYEIMFPPDKKEMTVTETAILKVYDETKKAFTEVGRVEDNVVISPGSRKANSELPIPDNAEEGKFMFAFMITADGRSDMIEMPLVIKK